MGTYGDSLTGAYRQGHNNIGRVIAESIHSLLSNMGFEVVTDHRNPRHKPQVFVGYAGGSEDDLISDDLTTRYRWLVMLDNEILAVVEYTAEDLDTRNIGGIAKSNGDQKDPNEIFGDWSFGWGFVRGPKIVDTQTAWSLTTGDFRRLDALIREVEAMEDLLEPFMPARQRGLRR